MSTSLPPLFQGMNDVDAVTGLRACEERVVAPGDVVIRAGEPARGLICVVDAALEVRAGDQVVGRVGPGGIVGEMALFEEGVRTASVVATSAGRVLVLLRPAYERLRDVVHPLAMNIERHAVRQQMARQRALSDRIAGLLANEPAPFSRPSERFFAALRALFGYGGMTVAEQVDAIAALARSPLLADAPRDALVAVAKSFKGAAFEAGHVLCVEGEVGDAMYFLAKGDVEVVVAAAEGGVKKLATLKPGAVFGLLSLADDQPRMATCVARTGVVVLAIERQGFKDLVDETGLAGSTFRRALLRSLSEQINYANQQLARHAPVETEDVDHARVGVVAHPISQP